MLGITERKFCEYRIRCENESFRMKVSRSKKLAHEEGLASYQLVGGVMAYQGDDG